MSTSNASTRLPCARAHSTAPMPSRDLRVRCSARGAGRGQRDRPRREIPHDGALACRCRSATGRRATSRVRPPTSRPGPAKRSSSTPVRGSTMRTAPCCDRDRRPRGRPGGTEPRPVYTWKRASGGAASGGTLRHERPVDGRAHLDARRRRRRSRRRARRRDCMLTAPNAKSSAWRAKRGRPVVRSQIVTTFGSSGRLVSEHDVPTVRGEVDRAHRHRARSRVRRYGDSRRPSTGRNSWISGGDRRPRA